MMKPIKQFKKIILIIMTLTLFLTTWIPIYAVQKEPTFFYVVTEEGEAVITGGRVGETVIIPTAIEGYPVAGIEADAFRDSDIKTVILQQGVRYIKEGAFAGCVQLEKVEFADGILYIGDNAFEGDSSLREVSVPDSVAYIGEMAFGNCTELVEIAFPKEAHVDDYALEGSAWQEAQDERIFKIRGSCLVYVDGRETNVLEIPYGITEILRCNHPKYDIEARKIILPDTVVRLDNNCFSGIWIDEINVPSGVKEIPPFAFGHSTLKTITLEKGVESIGMGAFCESSLNEIKLPDSLKVIGNEAFAWCKGLQKITIPGSVRYIRDNAFAGCCDLEEVVFEEGVEVIDVGAFDWCEKLERLQFPESLRCIEGINWSGMDRIYIPKGTIYIEDSIFENLSDEARRPVIYGQKGSRAQEVAQVYGLKFIEVENGNEMP